jgi:hypothetical protein
MTTLHRELFTTRRALDHAAGIAYARQQLGFAQ